MQRRTIIHATAVAAATCSGLAIGPAVAQGTWPAGKVFTYIVQFAAGGTTGTPGQPHRQTRRKGFGMEPAELDVAQIAAFQKAEVETWTLVRGGGTGLGRASM